MVKILFSRRRPLFCSGREIVLPTLHPHCILHASHERTTRPGGECQKQKWEKYMTAGNANNGRTNERTTLRGGHRAGWGNRWGMERCSCFHRGTFVFFARLFHMHSMVYCIYRWILFSSSIKFFTRGSINNISVSIWRQDVRDCCVKWQWKNVTLNCNRVTLVPIKLYFH